MNENRIIDHDVLGELDNQTAITFTFNGNTYKGLEGDTIASALLANGIRKLRVHEEAGTPRGIYCNIGHCFECRVTVNQTPGVRACITTLQADMVVESGKEEPAPLNHTIHPDDLPRTYAAFIQKSEGSKEGDPHV